MFRARADQQDRSTLGTSPICRRFEGRTDPIVGYQKRAIHHPGLPFLGKVLRCKQPELGLVHVWVKPELGSRVRPHEEVDQLFFSTPALLSMLTFSPSKIPFLCFFPSLLHLLLFPFKGIGQKMCISPISYTCVNSLTFS